MTDEKGHDSWNEWSRHVLKELDRLNAATSTLTSEMMRVQIKLETFQFTKVREDLETISDKLGTIDKKMVILDDKISGETGVIRKNEELTNQVSALGLRVREIENGNNRLSGKTAIIGLLITMILSATISAFISSGVRSLERPTPVISSKP